MKFLVIDDSPTMRKVVGLALKSANYEYDEAENGNDALSKMVSENYDFFLIDVNMPGMTGIELTKEIRKKPNYSGTPIIILTTEREQELKNQGKDAGANDWIIKPFQKEQLVSLIKSNL